MPQHKQTRRKTLRSALAHKAAADKFIDSLAGMQAKLNAALDKLNADAAGAVSAVAATGTLDLTADIVLTSASAGAARNGNTLTVEVSAAAANPTDTVLVDFSGAAGAIICTVTPNDGTNNAATPVDLTTAELVELINTGAVVGKNITLTDASSRRVLQTASGGDATALQDAGEGDGVVATFAGGADAIGGLDTNYVASCSLPSPILADGVYPAQNLSSMRRVWRSKLKHKRLADTLIEALAGLESNFNAMLAKLDAEAGTLDDTDYVSSLAVAAISPDAASLGQHKASLRKTMIDAMAHKKLGNEIVDAIAAAQNSFNAVLAKLDAATINGQCAALKVSAIDPDSM